MTQSTEVNAAGRTNVALHPTPFIGRDELFDRCKSAIEDHRLLTLTGPGGVGKTRLATELALGEAGELFRAEGGAWFCDLSSAEDQEAIGTIVARVLGLALQNPSDDLTPVVGQAINHLGPVMLVLDNCEHITEAVRAVCEAWLDAAPDLRLIATTREALRLEEEWLVVVPSLPAGQTTSPTTSSAAVSLLLHHASRYRGGYEPKTSDDIRALVELAEFLDGLPLALELAAKRLSLLGPHALLERLESSALSALGEQGEILWKTIQSSWDGLDESEQEAIVDCCVFRGVFSAEAAEAVIDVQQDSIDVVERLVEKSLLRVRPELKGFEMLTSIRELVLEQELSKTRRGAIDRFADYFAEHGLRLAGELRGAEPAQALEALRQIAENLEWMAQHDTNRERGLKAAVILGKMASGTGPIAPTERRLARVMATVERKGQLYLEALLVRSHLRLRRGATEAATKDTTAAIALAQELGDQTGEGRAWRIQGQVGLALHEDAKAADAIERAVTMLEDEDGPYYASAVFSRSVVSHASGRMADAESAARITLRVAERCQDSRGQLLALWSMMAMSLDQGELGKAATLLPRIDKLAAQVGDHYLNAHRLALDGVVRHLSSDLAGAIECYRGALESFRRIGATTGSEMCQVCLAVAECEIGEVNVARRRMAEAATASDVQSGARLQAMVRGYVALLEALAGDPESAQAVLDTARGKLAQTKPERAVEHVLELAEVAIKAAVSGRSIDPEDTPEPLEPGHSMWSEVLLAHRLLKQGRPRARSSGPRLAVATDGSWFELDDTNRVSLGNRPTLMSLLLALVRAQLSHPGMPLDRGAISEAVWPGERVLERAVQNRIRVAIAKLRSLGLREVVTTSKGGYHLSPELQIELTPPG